MNNYEKLGMYPHNIEGYEDVRDKLEIDDIAAVVRATGTGKSFIGLMLALENRDKRVLYVVPNNSIIEHIEEVIDSNKYLSWEKDFSNLKMVTYQSLINLSQEELEELDVDILIVDEFHHLGAPVWGKIIEIIINTHQNIKVLGMSAYTVRDRGTAYERDMTSDDEIFSGSVVSRYDLADAMIDGILPKPIYKSAYINLEETYEKIKKKSG